MREAADLEFCRRYGEEGGICKVVIVKVIFFCGVNHAPCGGNTKSLQRRLFIIFLKNKSFPLRQGQNFPVSTLFLLIFGPKSHPPPPSLFGSLFFVFTLNEGPSPKMALSLIGHSLLLLPRFEYGWVRGDSCGVERSILSANTADHRRRDENGGGKDLTPFLASEENLHAYSVIGRGKISSQKNPSKRHGFTFVAHRCGDAKHSGTPPHVRFT